MGLRAALFDLGGVLVRPSANVIFSQAEEDLALPRGFLNKVITQGGLESPYLHLMKGEITFLQWVPLMEEDCRKLAAASKFCLPEQFSIQKIFEDMISKGKINYPMLRAAITLRNKGYKTCILTNNWVDDGPQRDVVAQLMCTLSKHFDLVIESCRIGMVKPDPEIYKFALEALKVGPHEAVFLDDIGANLKKARELGMVTILAQDTDMALKELEKSTGIQFLNHSVERPIAVQPNNVAHGYVEVKGVAEAELEQDLTRTFKSIFKGSDEKMDSISTKHIENGILKNVKDPFLSWMLTEEDINYYVQQYKKSGFRGPLNWYRNWDANWRWSCTATKRRILIPALLVIAENDMILSPQLSENMEKWVPYLKKERIKNCGHWTQLERPREVNQILIKWLKDVTKNPSVVSML
ncbi:bifunctional epoxide hydrolase 2 [Gracilinanus agilis]|uniref:bifunctional epoxide hydrolase 2 n=1 Tax=Gracilinanus agilis TaxID=191870 RepID=UPI001CFE83FE|nr:bifunctional epoxide hydrolase 2 [Gracilinanus agilis]